MMDIYMGKGLAMRLNEFEKKISEHRDSLYRIAFMYLGDEAKALETVDEAVFTALLALPKLRRPDYFYTWLCRILINQCRQEINHKGQTASLDKISLSPSAETFVPPLEKALFQLPRELKEPVILFYFGNLSIAETAHTLKISKAKALSRLRRGSSFLGLEQIREESLYGQK